MSTRRYHVEELLGRGGMGAVYRARLSLPSGFEKEVAVKVLPPDAATPEALARLRDEARLLAQVRHRALPQVDGLVRLEDGRWAMVMEHVAGADLQRIRKVHGAFPARPALQIVAEVAAALHAAYTAGPPEAPLRLVHRDVKPSNVLLGDGGEVALLDFGIARADVSRDARTSTGMLVGTLSYMAPERFKGTHGAPSDVWSLGLLLVALLHRLPEHPLGTLPPAILAAQVDQLAGRASEDGPEGLEELLLEMLAVEPGDRPTAAEVSRRARALAERADLPDLERWAPRALAAVPKVEETDDWVGTTVTERLPEAQSTTTGGPIDGRAVGALGMLGGVGIALAALGVAATAVGWALWPDAPPPAPVVAAAVKLSPVRVTEDPAEERWPDLSADGRWLAWVVDGEVKLHDRVTGELRELTADFVPKVDEIDLADDGRSLLLQVGDAVWHKPLDGIARELTGFGGEISGLQLSPDGTRLAYARKEGPGQWAVRVRDLATGVETVALQQGGQARWSPDGERLVIVSRGGGLVTVRPDGTERAALDLDALEPRWVKDRLWVRNLRGPYDDLRWHAVTDGRPGGPATTAWAGTSRIVQLAASADGSRLAWTESGARLRLAVYPVKRDGSLGDPVPVPLSEGWAQGFVLSPDGSRVAYTAYRQGADEHGRARVVVSSLDGLSPREVGGAMSSACCVSWTPDGELWVIDRSADADSLLGEASDYGGGALVRLDPDTNDGEVVRPIDPDVWAGGGVSRDGETLGLVTADGRLALMPLRPGGKSPPIPARVGPPGWSPLGEAGDAVLVRHDALGIGLLDPATLEVTELGPGLDAVALDARRVLVHGRDHLAVLDLRSGKRKRVLDLPRVGSRGRSRLSLSADGRWVLVETTEIVADLWVSDLSPP